MQSKAENVDKYLEDVPAQRLDALRRLREMCTTHLTGYEESMVYGMPSYSVDGTVEVAFASQKQYISLYILKQDVFDRHRPALPVSTWARAASATPGQRRSTSPWWNSFWRTRWRRKGRSADGFRHDFTRSFVTNKAAA